MKYEKIYEGKTIVSPTSMRDILSEIPSEIGLEEIKIIPVYNVLSSGGSELVGFKAVAYRAKEDDF